MAAVDGRAANDAFGGFLAAATSHQFASRVAAFRRGLGETGYFEGRNVIVEYHWALHTTGSICRSGPMSALGQKQTCAAH